MVELCAGLTDVQWLFLPRFPGSSFFSFFFFSHLHLLLR